MNTHLIVHPFTGEQLDLAGATDTGLGTMLSEAREHERMLRELKRAISDEVLRRMDGAASWTLHLEGMKLAGSSPAPVEEFDELALRTDLLDLVDAGEITIEAVDRAVEPVVIYKARKAGINALRKLGGAVTETIDRHAHEVHKDRYVKVERTR